MMRRVTFSLTAALLLGLLVGLPGFAETSDDLVPAYTPSSKVDDTPIDLPNIEQKSLKNGLRVYYVPQSELPTVTARLLVLSGSLYNPLEQPGLTSFMADMLTKGTESLSAMEIAGEMDFIGGSISSGSGWNAVYVSTSVLSRDLETGLTMLADVALHPTFPEEEIERERRKVLTNIIQKKDNPDALASDAFDRFVYGNHPYGFPIEGTAESVEALTRDDLVAQHERLFVPGNAVLAISGDFDRKSAHKMVRKLFDDWSKGAGPEPALEDPERKEGGELLLVDKPDAVQSEIRMGYVLAPYKMGEDFHAFQLMNYIYGGGGFSSRLMLRVRNDLGLTYGIYSTLESMQQDGAYRIGVDTKPEATGQVIGEVIDVMKTFIAEGPTDEELQEAKAYLIGSYPRQFETPSNIATQFQSKLMFGYDDPAKEIAEYRAKINEVSRDDVMAMAKKYLMPGKLRIVVVGPGDAVKDQVTEYGNVTVKTVDEI